MDVQHLDLAGLLQVGHVVQGERLRFGGISDGDHGGVVADRLEVGAAEASRLSCDFLQDAVGNFRVPRLRVNLQYFQPLL